MMKFLKIPLIILFYYLGDLLSKLLYIGITWNWIYYLYERFMEWSVILDKEEFWWKSMSKEEQDKLLKEIQESDKI